MHRFLAGFIKTTILTSLFLLASYANAEILYSGAASALIDENGHAEIPSNYTQIGDSAFKDNSQLKTITIPDTITEIAYRAFYNSGIESVVIPDSVINIQNSAFYKATQLKNIELGAGINSIPTNAFYETAIRDISIPNNVTSIGSSAFKNTPLRNVTLSNSLTYIDTAAFEDTNLTTLHIPDSVLTIKSHAFKDLPLQEVTLGSSLTTIESYNFGYNSVCNSLTTVTSKMANIPSNLFKDCLALQNVTLENTITIGSSAFSGTAIQSITIPDTTTDIYSSAFKGTGLSEVEFGNSLETIHVSAFSSNQLTEIVLPDSLLSIEYYVFQSNGLTSVVIPDNVTSIKSSSFTGNSIKEVIIGQSISSLARGAFDCSIERVVYKQQKVEDYFSQCGSENRPSEIIITNSVIDIGVRAFFDNQSLKSIILPESIEKIEQEAFYRTGINEISLPEGLLSIGPEAFRFTSLEKVIIPSTLTSISSNVFLNTDISKVTIIEPADAYINYNAFDSDTFIEYNFCANNDTDLDGTVDCLDAFPMDGSESQDADLDGIGNNADTDDDNDGYNDALDAFPNDANEWVDTDSDGIGNNADNDDDGDGAVDSEDAFPLDENQIYDITGDILQVDSDNDGILDVFDPFFSQYSEYYDNCNAGNDSGGEANLNTDGDAKSNCLDPDDDNDGLLDVYEPFYGTNPLIPDSDYDGVLDGLDAFPMDNTESLDTDTDGIGNNADTDDDNDGHFDLLDVFPLDANEWMDSDLDGIGNNADLDDDNDGVADTEDAFPYTSSESVDTDGDGVGDNADAFPNDSSETLDTDLDGIGNNADDDDDNDGVADADDSDPLNDAIGALESQNLFVMGNPVAVNGYLATISVGYDVSNDNSQLNGIGFRVHYDSSIYSYFAVENTLNDSVVVDGMGPYQDVEDFDNDSTTDSYLVFGWASVSGEWPNVELPAKLSDIKMFVNWADYEAGSTTSNINFSIVDNAEGYEDKATNYAMTVLPATWDFDGNGMADALTDGLMLLRYTFNITDLNMTTGAIADNATLSPTQVVDNMHRALPVADIDGNGSTDALTDGLLLLRYMFNLRGENLVSGAISSDATRTTAEEIEGYIELYMPDGLPSPVQSEQNFMVGDWRLASAPEADYTDEIINGTAEWNQTSGTGDHKFNCMADDVYKFDQNGTFSYIHGEGTYAREGITSFYTDADCSVIRSPWDGSFDMYFVVNEDESTIKVVGKGAYIGLPHVANGINEIPEPFFAPDEVIYNYTKISDNEIQLDILGGYFGYRFRLQRVLQN